MMAAPGDYPVRVGFDAPIQIARWRPFVNWLLAIPQLIIVSGLQALARALLFVSFFAVLFTRSIPRSIYDMVAMTHRYQWRVISYAGFLRQTYPPLDFTATTADPGNDPATYSIEYPAVMARWKPLYKWFLAIPHIVVLVFLTIAMAFVTLAAALVVLFTAEYPRGMRDFVVGVARWWLRVDAYIFFLVDDYPAFTLRPNAPGATPAIGAPVPTS